MDSSPIFVFTASYDRTTKIISTLVCLAIAIAVLISQNPIVGSLGALLIALSYAYSPRGYECSTSAITVHRLIGNKRIQTSDIREVRAATKEDFRNCIRLWGNGGLFGYYGKFRTSVLGTCDFYLTNRKKAVVVVTDSRTALFSPDDVDGFLGALKAYAPVRVGPVREPLGTGLTGAVVGFAVAAVVIGAVAFAMLYSPGPPRYTLTRDTLTIHDRFYPVTLKADSVDTAHMRIVDIMAEPTWRVTLRTNGFANPHYRSGWFRTAGGQRIRLYRASGTRLVLLPPKGEGAPVMCEFADPEKFLDDARRAWQGRP